MIRILADKTILITRDESQSADLARQIAAHGGSSIFFPTIKITAPDDWQECDAAIRELESFDWLVFTSINSVRYFFKRLQKFKAPHPHKIAAIGRKTCDELERRGIDIDLMPEVFSAKGLLNAFDQDLSGRRFLLPSSNIARDELMQGLCSRQADVVRVTVYQNTLNRPDNIDIVLQSIRKGDIDCLTFFSPSAWRNFAELAGVEIIRHLAETQTLIAAIGPTTAAAIRDAGMTKFLIPEEYTSESLVKSLLEHFKQKDDS